MGKDHKKREQVNKPAILLAHFGTTYPSALPSLMNIGRVVQTAFPGVETRHCFTSNMVRKVWTARRSQSALWLLRGVPREILHAQSFLGAVGNLQDENFRTIIVQPTHIYHGEQFEDLKSFVQALQSIRTIKRAWAPFETIALSRPALGTCGILHDYALDINEVVGILGDDVLLARQMGAALVYVAHGNDYFSSGVFHETLKVMQEAYPDVRIHIGMVEGYPGIEDIAGVLQREGSRKVLMKPLMITAGDHAHNDIDNESPDSWKSGVESVGCEVVTQMNGLGSNNAFAELFVRRIRETAADNSIELNSHKIKD